jgi:hypothetical protein
LAKIGAMVVVFWGGGIFPAEVEQSNQVRFRKVDDEGSSGDEVG